MAKVKKRQTTRCLQRRLLISSDALGVSTALQRLIVEELYQREGDGDGDGDGDGNGALALTVS